MFYLDNNEQPLSPGTDYWRARAEELERHLAETRLLLMEVAELLPAEHLGRLKLRLIQLGATQTADPRSSGWPESQPRAE